MCRVRQASKVLISVADHEKIISNGVSNMSQCSIRRFITRRRAVFLEKTQKIEEGYKKSDNYHSSAKILGEGLNP